MASPNNRQQLIVDADTHILEPPDLWTTWLPKKYHDKAPKLVKDAEGGDAWLFAGEAEPDPIGLVSTPGMPYDEFKWLGVTYEDARTGCYDGTERLKDMDYDGIWANLNFAPQRTMGHFLADEDDDFVAAGIEAYNNFLIDQFCVDTSRMIPLAQLTSLGLDSAIVELQKAKERGFKGVVIGCWPNAGDSIQDEDDRFWAAAQEIGMPVCIHINLISRASRLATKNAAKKAGKALYGGAHPKAKAKAVGNLGGVFSMVAGTMSSLIFTGVFERFPDLHIAMIETGVGWLPHYLEQLDDKYWRNRSWGDIPISQPPSYYWRQNLSASFILDPIGIQVRDAVGVRNMMWSSDYPHHGNDWPYSRKVINDTMGHIAAEERDLIIGGNAIRIFDLETPA